MTEPGAVNHPATSAPAPPADIVRLVLGALGFGALLGLGAQALVTWTVRTLQAGSAAPSGPPSLTSGPALVLLLGTLAAIVVAGAATWIRLAPIRNPWRQGMLALIAGLGSFVLSMVTIPIDRKLGPPGLIVLAIVAIGAAFLLARRQSARQSAA